MNFVTRYSLTSSPIVKSVDFSHFSCRVQTKNAVLLWDNFCRLKRSQDRRGRALGEKGNRSSRSMCLRLPPCQTQPCYVSTRSFTHFQSDSWIFRLGRIAACKNMQVNRGCNLICGQSISIAFS